ncbi:hypothetical protein GAMM_40230 [Gammaproteobacteria bacterium]
MKKNFIKKLDAKATSVATGAKKETVCSCGTEKAIGVGIKFDLTNLEKFRGLSDEEIKERFNKAILPEIIKRVRSNTDGNCPVCNPWSYSVF